MKNTPSLARTRTPLIPPVGARTHHGAGMCARANTPTTYTLTLVAKQCDIPAENRMRQLLKIALRAFDFRCVEVKEISPTAPETAPHGTPCNGNALDNTKSSIPQRANEVKKP